MESLKSCVLLLAKLIMADGRIDAAEEDAFRELLDELGLDSDLEKQIKQADKCSVNALCQGITNTADKFFTRVRCHLMVRVDGEVDDTEQEMLDEVISRLKLDEDLELLLDSALDAEEAEMSCADLEKIESLYHQSSFYTAS